MATTFAASSRVTVVGEMMGRRLFELSYVQDVYQPHPLMPGVETMRWLTADRWFHDDAAWPPAPSGTSAAAGCSNTNLLIRVTDGGLRSRVTPAVSLDYDFGL